MNWKTYHIELVTPTFLAGADQRKAEVRVPSIRGQVRWWFRALGGGPREEKLLFGGVHGEVQASAVRMRLGRPVRSVQSGNLRDFVRSGNMNHPISYLLWPLRPQRTSEQKRGFLARGTTFSLQVSIDPRLTEDQRARFEASLHAWILLGSLGTRSRRGFGSLGPAEESCDFPWHVRDLDEWCGALDEALEPFVEPSLKVLQVGEKQTSWEDAVAELGRWLKEFRAGSGRSGSNPTHWGKSDHDEGAGYSNTGVLYRPVLGLPLTQRYQGGPTVETQVRDADRWASPLHLKVVRCGPDFFPVALFLPEMAMPEGTEILLKSKRADTRKRVDWGLIEAMMREHDPYPVRLYPGEG